MNGVMAQTFTVIISTHGYNLGGMDAVLLDTTAVYNGTAINYQTVIFRRKSGGEKR